MILGFKEKYTTGKFKGQATNFKPLILSGDKVHTFREGQRWRPGMAIQMATGVRTTNYNQFNILPDGQPIPSLSLCKLTQVVRMEMKDGVLTMLFDGSLPNATHDIIMANDGLSPEQFFDWFFPDGDGVWIGQIIHWTDLKY